MSAATNWIIGLDLLPFSNGALEFGAWLAHASQESTGLAGVHVLERRDLGVTDTEQRHVVEAATEAARRCVAASACGDVEVEIEIAEADDVDAELRAQCSRRNATGLIIGRRAGRSDDPWVRLGRVARRALRRLNAPVIITPSDLERADVGDGAILVAVDPHRDDSLEAVAFAQRFGALTGREVRLIHATAMPSALRVTYLPGEQLAELGRRFVSDSERALAAWAERHQLGALGREVVEGSVISGINAVADRCRSPLVVCGSRRLSLADRLFSSSVGSQMASASPRAIAVVPPA